MKTLVSKFLFVVAFLLTGLLNANAQGSTMLIPFVGKDKSEVILAYNDNTGKSVEWYFDETLKKMKQASAGWQLPAATGITGNVKMQAYIDPDKSEVILVWNSANGQSASWYYDEATKQMKKSKPEYQLPADLGITGTIMMYPYIGADNSEVILCWDTQTGKSVEYYFDKGLKKFRKADAKFQLPADIGITGNVMMHPYIGNDGSEITLTWSKATGKSIAFYLNNAQGKVIKAEPNYQLPSLDVTSNVMMYPYVGKDGSEVILVWNTTTGQSVSYYFENSTKKFTKSTPEYQLPANPGVGSGVMMVPFVNKSKDEVIYVWNTTTGQSINYYFDETLKKYNKSEAKWQLPMKPL
jgi:hypothetical protein